jgi:hypothetical protein
VAEAAGRHTIRLSDPGPQRLKSLADLLADTSVLEVVVEGTTVAQHYSGKKKQYTFKWQIAVDDQYGRVADAAPSVQSRTSI